ncbi:MAG: hypothetical protein FD189_1091 [Elusimicrobia bacterium]|nr:MAG: hypothetical protein FD189_1091 [Elusimicrobiota bacterium]
MEFDHPTVHTPLAALTVAGAGWEAITLPDKVVFVDVAVTVAACYIVPQIGTGNPAQNGCLYAVGNHRLPAFNSNRLMCKTATAKIEATAHCWGAA